MKQLAILLLILVQYVVAEELSALETVRCTGGRIVEVSVEAAEAVVDGVVKFNTRLYRVDGILSLPAPTIIMKAGEQCTLKVINNLVGEKCPNDMHRNDFHCPDTTSIHTHGLHVSPDEDNIDTHIEPKRRWYSRADTHSYTYNVPEYHLQGTHWYHSHHHGSTTLQAMGGMAGILLVEGADNFNLPKDVLNLYKNSVVPPIMLNHMAFNGSDHLNAFNFLDYVHLVESYDPITVPVELEWGDTSSSGKDFYVVNGQFNPEVTIESNDATLLRIVHAGDICHLVLRLEQDVGKCEILLLARDGVFHQTPYLRLDSIILTQGTRVDVVIKCDHRSIGQRITVAAVNDAPIMPTLRNIKLQKSVFTINVIKGKKFKKKNKMPTSNIPMPEYLTSLMKSLDVQVGGERGVEAFQFSATDGNLGINSVPFPGWQETNPDIRYLEEFCLNKIYQLTVIGIGSNDFNQNGPVLSSSPFHPFHMHINHFQIYNGSDPSGQVLRDGEWRDVVPAWAEIGVKIRMRLFRFTGEVVTHCHLLQHEDSGMMGLYLIKECPSSFGSLSTGLLTTQGPKLSSQFDLANASYLVIGIAVGIVIAITCFLCRCKRSHLPLEETNVVSSSKVSSNSKLQTENDVLYGSSLSFKA